MWVVITNSVYGLDLHCSCMVLCYRCMVRAMLAIVLSCGMLFSPVFTSVWYLDVLSLVNSLCGSHILRYCAILSLADAMLWSCQEQMCPCVAMLVSLQSYDKWFQKESKQLWDEGVYLYGVFLNVYRLCCSEVSLYMLWWSLCICLR